MVKRSHVKDCKFVQPKDKYTSFDVHEEREKEDIARMTIVFRIKYITHYPILICANLRLEKKKYFYTNDFLQHIFHVSLYAIVSQSS